MRSISKFFVVLGFVFVIVVSFFAGYLFSSHDSQKTLLLILFCMLLSGFLLFFLYLTRSIFISSENNLVSQLSKTLLIDFPKKGDEKKIVQAISEKVELVEHKLKPLELVLANLSVGILIFRKDKSLLEANRVCGEMLGVSPTIKNYQENIYKSFNKFGLDVHIGKVLAGYEAKIFDVQIDSETKKWLQIETNLISNGGLSEYVVTIMRDVTRLKKLEQMRKDFVSNVSHQLRTPITSINGFVETLLQNKMYNDEMGKHFLEIIYEQGVKLTGIIDGLLTLSSLELRDVMKRVAVKNLKIAPVIEAAVEACRHLAQAKNIPVFIECDSNIMCRVNAKLIEQAIINLIDNSIKYSCDGSEVNIRVRKDKKFVVIGIFDIGVGIPNDQLGRVFERFYRVSRASDTNIDGSGLGLAIAKHIAEVHNGDITVESELEKGSTFTLLLPK